MELGFTTLGRDLETISTCARLAEELGFTAFGLGDSPTVALDPFVCLPVLAGVTRHLRLGTSVLNPQTRHPLVIANACLTLDRVAPDRIFLGIGTGNSGVRQAGLAPVSLAELRQTVLALRALHAKEPAELNGVPLSLARGPARIPVLISASGPKTLRLAGEVADGVLINVGADPNVVAQAIAEVKAGAEAVGRDWGRLEIWVFGIGCIDVDHKTAVDQVKSAVTGAAIYLLRSPLAGARVPAELQTAVSELFARYSYADHFAPGHSANARLAEELGVDDYLIDRFSFAGTPEGVRNRVAALQAIGVERFWFSLSAAREPDVQLRRLAAALELPSSRS